MEWILPITVIPGIALLVLSTSALLTNLNQEINTLNLKKDKYSEIIDLKIIQLKKLNWALVLFYIGILFFLFAGIVGALINPESKGPVSGMIAGVAVFIAALVILIIYGFKSIYIRQKHLKL